MNIKRLVVDFVSVFAVTLIVSVVVKLLSNLVVRGARSIDWETSFRFATLFGIILPLIGTRGSKGKQQRNAAV